MNQIKLPVAFFDSDRIKALRAQKDGDTVILLYAMLITTAAKSDANGLLMLCDDIPYDDKILSGILSLPLAVVKNGLELLVKFGLLALNDNIYSLVDYDEFADLKAIKERKQNAERQARFKAKSNKSTVTETLSNLRRSLGTAMVAGGVSVQTAAQVFGDSQINSMKQYISLDVKHLKMCALALDGIAPIGGDVK